MNDKEKMKKLEKKYRKTKEGKRAYKFNIFAAILYIISFVFLLIVIFNEGNILTGVLVGLVIMSNIFTICASFLCMAYYKMFQEYVNETEKEDKKKK